MLPRINLYGGPGAGKSTLAARLFAALKAEGTDIELVTEFAKLRAYENRPIQGWDYVHTFSTQLRSEQRFLEAGTSIVTDSPMLLQCFYARRHDCQVAQWLYAIAAEWEKEFPSCNIYLPPAENYRQKGRFQDKAEAQRIGQCVRAMLEQQGQAVHTYGHYFTDFESLLDFIRWHE